MNSTKSTYLNVKDHSVTGEMFQLVYNDSLELLETLPQPKPEDLPKYYKSEDYISHTDSKRNLLEKVYHIVRKRSLKFKLKLVNLSLYIIISTQSSLNSSVFLRRSKGFVN